MNSDGSIIIDTKINTDGIANGERRLQKEFERVADGAKRQVKRSNPRLNGQAVLIMTRERWKQCSEVRRQISGTIRMPLSVTEVLLV